MEYFTLFMSNNNKEILLGMKKYKTGKDKFVDYFRVN